MPIWQTLPVPVYFEQMIPDQRPPEPEQSPVNRGGRPVDPAWDRVRAEYVQSDSLSIAELSRRHGIPLAGLRKRAQRGAWTKARADRMGTAISKRVDKQLVTLATKKAVESATVQATSWIENVLRLASKALSKTGDVLDTAEGEDVLKTAVSTLDLVDKIGRRALRLDAEDTTKTTLLTVNLNAMHMLCGSPSSMQVPAQVIDCQGEPLPLDA